MTKSMGKAERLNEMTRLYLQRAYSDIEMAERMGVDRTTAYRDRVALEKRAPFMQDAEGRYYIDRSRFVSNVRLNMAEALSLYLAARRLSQQTRFAQNTAASGLEKLAVALHQPMTQQLVKAAEQILAQERDEQRTEIFATVARAWSERLQLRITYQALAGRGTKRHLFSPYLLEPSPWGDGIYLIGKSDLSKSVITLRLNRIERASLSGPFEIPDDFDEQELLRHAWGIWADEYGPEAVVLHFRGERVVRRLKETIWHPLEKLEMQPDGSAIWRASIAQWREMLPWVRGWGSSVTVLEPVEMRAALKREARKLAELYDFDANTVSQPRYYAHSKPDIDESEWQLLKDHLTQTGELAYELGRNAGLSDLAQVAGILHDIGKYSAAFQARLRGSNRRVDHATAGAREIVKLFPTLPDNMFAELLSYCIAGHHTGLPDYGSLSDVEGDGTLLARREKTQLEDYSAYATEIDAGQLELKPLRIKVNGQFPGYSLSFLTRMLFSTLVDADWLDTERYMQGEEKPRGQYASLNDLAEQFHRHLQRFENPQTPINRQRTETLHACRSQAGHEPGYFTLTVPTGGAKTLTSMAFALDHAIAHDLKRIIYVIPFTSIIEQNAAVFREALGALGAENVLEHHANFDWEELRQAADSESGNVYEKLKLAAENWDIPIVVTTNVQFFESLFASKKMRARKLHNIARSVVIFDEVQTLPGDYLQPCMTAVHELVQNYGVSTVFCTATQPSLQRFFPAATRFTELAPDPQQLFDFYRRINVKEVGALSDEELLAKIEMHEQALCIVNTRRHAKGLFDQLPDNGRFHLSTLMCPVHRRETLLEIRRRLQNGETCRVISTQVMEAGVDVDFPVGYRALTGLDSIIQAAGRVNREAKQANADVFVFEPRTEHIKRTPLYIAQTGAVAKSILREFKTDPTSIAAVNAYYKQLYMLHAEGSFDAKGILGYLDKGPRNLGFDFKTAAENFKLIDDVMVTVIIPYDEEARNRLHELAYTPYPLTTLRKLQVCSVNIYEQEFRNLQSLGVIQTVSDICFVLDETQMERFYHPQTGLLLPKNRGGEAIFFD